MVSLEWPHYGPGADRSLTQMKGAGGG